ncbi:MAG: hypothetical protein JJD92_08200 [Frankiaceae bacterium]|nr:hypothetical protein [Frankiaceae bacterium]
MSVTPSRRRLLQAAMLSPALVACTGASREPRPVHPDVALRAAAIARERALIERYRAAAASSASTVATRIAGLAEEHEAHLAALSRSTPGALSPSPTTSPPAALIRVPTLAQLVAAERAAATAHAADALKASRELAAVLASLAASEASHLVVLA